MHNALRLLPYNQGEDVAVKLFLNEDDVGSAGAEVNAELSILGSLDHPYVLKASALESVPIIGHIQLAGSRYSLEKGKTVR